MYLDLEISGSESSALPMKSNCLSSDCLPSISTQVFRQAGAEDQRAQNDPPLTKSDIAPPSPTVDLHRRTGQVVGDNELIKLPVNLKLNGYVQLDEGPLDLSVSRRDSAGRTRRSANPEGFSTSSRPRCSKSQALTSASLARLVKRFGITATTTTSLTSVTSSVTGSGGGGRSGGRDSHEVSPMESSSRPRSVAVPQPTTLLNPRLVPGNLLGSPERPTTTFCSPPPSRWRRDSFWANGGWLAGATAASSLSSVAGHQDSRKRPQPAATIDSGSVDCQSHLLDAQSVNLNRKMLSDHRKSLHRSSTRLRCERKFSSSSDFDSSRRTSKVPPCARETNRMVFVDIAQSTKVNDSKPTSAKLPRTDDSHDTLGLQGEPVDSEKKRRQDDGDSLTATTTPVRGKLTSLRCGSCGSQFESLYCLTVHLEETGHKPASDVAVLPLPSPATSPSSSDRKPTVASPAASATTSPMSAPQRLVRGQDVWLARGVEQTDRILRCIQCNAPARSLAELTLHMVHTKHYINIVGPTTSATSNVVGCDVHQRAATAVQPPTTLRDKSADTMTVKARNGLRIASNKEHGLINTKTSCRDRHHDISCASVPDDVQAISQQQAICLPGAAAREHDINRNACTDKDTSAVCSVAMESKNYAVDGMLRTSERSAAFCVRNLIASEIDGKSSCNSPLSTATLHHPLSTQSSSSSSHRRDVTSSVAPEVTSSSDERRSPVNGRLPTVAESVLGHDVISA